MSDSAVTLEYSEDQRVATLTLNRPARRNALSNDGWQRLFTACDDVARRKDVRALLLRGEGAHFCAGADIHELSAHITESAWMLENQHNVARALDAYEALTIPTIAAVTGSCFGGGLALATSSDFVFVDHTARFAVTPAKLGLSYRLVDCQRVVDSVGTRRARELLLAAREIDAVTAVNWGLANAISADALTAANAQTQALVRLSGISQRAIKQNLRDLRAGITRDHEASIAAFRAAFAAADFTEGASAFLEKRPPNFT